MVQIISGVKGSGKTGKIIEAANSENTNGNVVFLSTTDSYRVSIKPQIKFIDTKEEGVSGSDNVIAFIKGMLAANYDITALFIDGTLGMIKATADSKEFKEFYNTLVSISDKSSVKFVITVSCDEKDLQNYIK